MPSRAEPSQHAETFHKLPTTGLRPEREWGETIGQAPEATSQATDTHPKQTHTETFHKLPTTRLHPERETLKPQTQTVKQATETCHKLLLPCTI